MKERLRYWVPVVLYMGCITYISSLSSPEEQFPAFALPLNDKIIHGTEYAILGILSFRAFEQASGSLCANHAFFLGVLTATVFGISDEFHQSFVPLRQADSMDLLADFVGATIGILVWQRVRLYYQKHIRKPGIHQY